jgi:hypothetical protein
MTVDVEVSGLATWLIEAGCIRGLSVHLAFMGKSAVDYVKVHDWTGIGNFTYRAGVSGIVTHYIIGLVLVAEAGDGTTFGRGSRHEFYYVYPGSLDTAENGDETRIVAPNFGIDVPDVAACEPHGCRARYRTAQFFELPALKGILQDMTDPTTMDCAGGLCRIANGCVSADHHIHYYRETGSPMPLFVFANNQGRPASVAGPANKILFEHPLADRHNRSGIDQRIEGTTLFLSTGYANNVGHFNQFAIKLLALRRHAGLANITRILALVEPTFVATNETENLDQFKKHAVAKNGLYDLHLDLLRLAFEDSGWEPPPIFGIEPGTSHPVFAIGRNKRPRAHPG